MKSLITLLLLTICTQSAHATGKLSLQNNFPDGGNEYRPTIGLMVYEKLTKDSALNMWTGYGQQFLAESQDVDWLVAKAQVDVYVKGFTVAPGIQYKYLVSGDESLSPTKDNITAFVRLDYKLW